MGIYNCETMLAEAVECIVNQTYKNWELILCDDCSTDHTVAVAERFVNQYPSQIRLLKNPRNMGLNYTLNKCLKESKGEYIARMDGDDLCSPVRFQKEVDILIKHPEFAIVSTEMEFFDENGVWGHTNVKEYPEPKDFIHCTQFCHAGCMVRREAYLAVDGYSVDKRLLRVEDYHLWIKMYTKGYRGMNIREPLYQMRNDRNATRRRTLQNRLNECYVKHIAIQKLNLPFYGYIFSLKPIFLALMPNFIYALLYSIKNRKKS